MDVAGQSQYGVEQLEARLSLMERRLQLVSDELSVALEDRIAESQQSNQGNEAFSLFPTSVEFDADSISQFSLGFYEREYDPAGKAFRWTGGGPICELRFFIDRAVDRTFRMDTGETAPQILSQLCGFVDYAPISLNIEKRGSAQFVTGTVPKRSYTRLAVITFLLGKEASGGKKSTKAELHWLGFQFYSFEAGHLHKGNNRRAKKKKRK